MSSDISDDDWTSEKTASSGSSASISHDWGSGLEEQLPSSEEEREGGTTKKGSPRFFSSSDSVSVEEKKGVPPEIKIVRDSKGREVLMRAQEAFNWKEAEEDKAREEEEAELEKALEELWLKQSALDNAVPEQEAQFEEDW